MTNSKNTTTLNSPEKQFLLNFTHKKDENPPLSPIREQDHPLSSTGQPGLPEQHLSATTVTRISTKLTPISFKDALLQDMTEEEAIPLPDSGDDLEIENIKTLRKELL